MDRRGVHGAGDRPGEPVPAQCHHRALPRLSGSDVCHLPPPPLLQAAGAAALEPRSAPLPVSRWICASLCVCVCVLRPTLDAKVLLHCSLLVKAFNRVALLAKCEAPVDLYHCGKCVKLVFLNYNCVVFFVSVARSYLDNDSTLTDKDTVMLVEEAVLLIAFAVTEIKRLLFIDSMIDSIKVWGSTIKEWLV